MDSTSNNPYGLFDEFFGPRGICLFHVRHVLHEVKQFVNSFSFACGTAVGSLHGKCTSLERTTDVRKVSAFSLGALFQSGSPFILYIFPLVPLQSFRF